jgi:hypothetical protein
MESTSEQVEIKGITYVIIEARTPEQTEAEGHPNTARVMRKNRATRSMLLRRITGQTVYSATEFTGGRFSKVLSLSFGWRP